MRLIYIATDCRLRQLATHQASESLTHWLTSQLADCLTGWLSRPRRSYDCSFGSNRALASSKCCMAVATVAVAAASLRRVLCFLCVSVSLCRAPALVRATISAERATASSYIVSRNVHNWICILLFLVFFVLPPYWFASAVRRWHLARHGERCACSRVPKNQAAPYTKGQTTCSSAAS